MATGINNLVSYDLKGVKESFANWISNISPSDTPFVSLTGKESVKNKFFQWQEDALNGVVDNAVAEGSDAGTAVVKGTTVRHNVTQILRKTVQVSDTANALASYGRGRELQYQMEKAAKELKRDIEFALLQNGDAEEGTKSASGDDVATQARKTAGFTSLVADKDVASDEDTAAIVHRDVAATGTLTEDDIFTLTNGLYLAGAKATHIMFHPKYAPVFSSLMEKATGGAATRVRMFDGSVDQRINKYVSEMVDPLGQRFTLCPNRFMPRDRIYFFNPKDWTQMILREPGAQLLAKTGSFDKYMIEIELGLRHRNRYASGVLVVNPAVAAGFSGTGLSGDDATGYTFSAVAGSGAVTITRTPAATAAIVIKTPGTRTVASAATTSTVVLTPGSTAGAAEDIVLTVDGVDITISATVTAAPTVPTVTAVAAAATAVSGTAKTIPVAQLFTFGGGSVAGDYNFTVNPVYAGVTVAATGIATVAATAAAGTAKVVATHKVTASVTATKDIVISAPAPAPTITNDGSPTTGTVGTPVIMKAKSSDTAATIAYTIKAAGTTAAGAAVNATSGSLTVTGAGDAIVTATGSTGGSVDLPKVVFTAPTPTVTTVTVTGPSAAASPLASYDHTQAGYQLSAAVAGTNSPAQTVTWSVEPAVTGVAVSATGLVTATAAVPGGATIRATSTVDATKYGDFVITAIA